MLELLGTGRFGSLDVAMFAISLLLLLTLDCSLSRDRGQWAFGHLYANMSMPLFPFLCTALLLKSSNNRIKHPLSWR